MKLGLALSGGGFRATLFHLGIVRYLCDAGLLGYVQHITSVSGGSVLAAHLALNWSRYLDPKQFDDAAQKVIDLARLDLRGRIQRRLATHLYVTYLRPESLLRWPPRLRRFGTIRGTLFERYLARYLYGDSTLGSIAKLEPQAPVVDILATNLSLGSLAYFTAGRFVANDMGSKAFERDFRLARAVAISAAFPGFFPTTEVNSEVLLTNKADFPNREYLADGGIYDNLGLRRFRTLLESQPGLLDRILVCDASGHFDWLVERETLGLLKTAWRSNEIFMKRLADLECEIAGLGKTGEPPGLYVHLPIDEIVKPQPEAELLPEMAQEQLKNIRTDLDRFDGDAIDALQWHGYAVAGKVVGPLFGDSPAARWRPKAHRPDMPAEALAKSLRQARFRKLRLLSWGDRISFLHLGTLLFALTVGAVWLWDLYQLKRFGSYMDDLPKDSFGQIQIDRILSDPAAGEEFLERVAAAGESWPTEPQVQIEAARAGYTLMSQSKDEGVRAQGIRQMDRALAALQALEDADELDARRKDLFYQLRGHSHLARGERLKGEGRFDEAHQSWLDAYESYEQQRRVAFHGLYGLEFNLCNTGLLIGRLDDSLQHCEQSHRFALEEPKPVVFWQAKFNIGDIYYRKGLRAEAAKAFVEALEISKKKTPMKEDGLVRQYLHQNHEAALPALCLEQTFKIPFADVCASLKPLPAPEPGPGARVPHSAASTASAPETVTPGTGSTPR